VLRAQKAKEREETGLALHLLLLPKSTEWKKKERKNPTRDLESLKARQRSESEKVKREKKDKRGLENLFSIF